MRASVGLCFVVFIWWAGAGIDGNFEEAPHFFLFFFCLTFLIALAIRKKRPRASGVIGFLISLLFSYLVLVSALGGISDWPWHEYVLTFIGGPLSLISLVTSVQMVFRKS